MIANTSSGAADLVRATASFDSLFSGLAGKQIMALDGFAVWAVETGGPAFSIPIPEDGKSYSAGNGAMVALTARDKAQVDAVDAKALRLSGRDEGKPGFRVDGFYAAYFREPDGDKLNINHMAG